MTDLLHACLIVCPLVFLAGFVDSVAGGGGLITIPAYLLVGIPIHLASGTNKVVACMGTTTAVWRYARGGKIQWKAAVWAAGGALAGAAAGARLALWFPEEALQACMLVALPLVAVVLAVKKDFGKDAVPRQGTVRGERALSVAIGLVIGLYDGMIGPGTGTFLAMAFTLVLGMDLLTASGCAKVVNLASNLSSAVVWICGGKVIWALVAPAMACSMLGNLCGARFALRGGAGRVRVMIFVVLGLLFVKMLWEVVT